MTRFTVVLLTACITAPSLFAAPAPAINSPAPVAATQRAKPKAGEVTTVDWDALLPDAELNLPPITAPAPKHDYLSGERSPAAVQEGSMQTRKDLDGAKLRIPGFIVPLSTTPEGNVKEFFLVPYFGACIHVPPPPANQMVYVTRSDGFKLKSIFQPMWVTGTMRTQSKGARLGVAAYSMQAERFELFEY